MTNINELRHAVNTNGLYGITGDEVLELLDCLEAAENLIAGVSDQYEEEKTKARAFEQELDALKQQEPVAWATKLALRIGKDVLGFQVSAVNMWGENGVALYLAPGAQGDSK